jgi:cellulose synthase/poly-beta-1,6-N-acetylglucosamine synthase-like glycosyltransferase
MKKIFKPLIPSQVISFYHEFRKPLALPDRSQVTLFAQPSVLPDYQPRCVISPEFKTDENRGSSSIISTVYNEAKTIGPWLESILAQTLQPNEIVITDGGSTDGTLSILQNYADDFPIPIQIIIEAGANISRGRNLAIAAASHEIIICSDCGSVLEKDWLLEITSPFEIDPKIDVSAGYYDVLVTNTLSRLAKKFFGIDLTKVDPQKFLPSGRSLAFRKRIWKKAGGYPEWLTDAGEDTFFDMRLKAQTAKWGFVPSARVSWYAPDTLRKLLKTYFRYSRGDGETGVSAELYWFKVVELLRLWPLRLAKLLIGIILISQLSWVGIFYFIGWIFWSLFKIFRKDHQTPSNSLVHIILYEILLELVGTVQPVAFGIGVLARSRIKDRKIIYYQNQLLKILESNSDRHGVIVYPPTHDWGFMFQRPHQIARAFAKKDWLYFYCTNNNQSDAVFGFYEVESGLFLAHVPPETFAKLDHPRVILGSAWNRDWLQYFVSPEIVYDHYDDLEISGARLEDHLALLNDSDLILVSAKRLLKSVSRYRDDALFIPNGVDYEFIQTAKPHATETPPKDLKPILELGKPMIGYSGALAKWFDYDLIIKAAHNYPQYSFVLVGVDYDGTLAGSSIIEMPNIYYLGMKAYQELFNYIWRFDIAVIPFEINDITLATSPVKLFEYLACRKPVVTTDLPECRDYSGIFLAKNDTQFIEFLGLAMETRNDKDFIADLNHLAKQNTWEQRITKLFLDCPKYHL